MDSNNTKNTAPNWAFICAAGMGSRMRPLTDTMPKPLVEINGRPIIDYTIDHLMAAGITDIVLNTHYLPEKLENWAQKRAACTPPLRLTLYHEETLLDTGGALQNILTKDKRTSPFYMINGDALWENASNSNSLKQMSDKWQSTECDLLLLLQDTDDMILTHGNGDYTLVKDNTPKRTKDSSGHYMFTGMRIATPQILKYAPKADIFSFLACMDGAETAGRLTALIHSGIWHHISTVDDVDSVSAHLKNAAKLIPEKQAI